MAQAEGWRHLRMKRLIAASLEALENGRTYRRHRANKGYALEVQLSSTSIQTISERNHFYRQEGAIVTWFTDLPPDGERRMYLKDLEELHRGNVFLVDEETARQSTKEKQFKYRLAKASPRRRLLDLLAMEPLRYGTNIVLRNVLFNQAQKALKAAGAELPPLDSEEFQQLERRMAGHFSAEFGHPIGFHFESLSQVAHQSKTAIRMA